MKTYSVKFWNFGMSDRNDPKRGNDITVSTEVNYKPVVVEARDMVEAAARAACYMDDFTRGQFKRGHLGILYIEEGSPKLVYGQKLEDR